MAKFLIEVPHEESVESCVRAIKIFLETGSHFLTHADWGCKDGVHKAWVRMDLASKEECRHALPPQYRDAAKIVELNEFSMEEIEELMGHHAS